MKYFHSFLVLFLFATVAKAGDAREAKSLATYEVTQKGPDKTFKKTEAAFDLVFVERSGKAIAGSIRLSYNGKEKNIQADAAGKQTLKVKPGKYKFQFFYNSKHLEVYTDSIPVKAAHRAEIKVYFDRSDIIMTADKPVIYLYPEKTTEVSVKLQIGGDFLFTYPAYNEGWKVTAHPDGTQQQGDKTFKYLFWEGKTNLTASNHSEEGFVLETANLTAFFEEKLSHLGLNGAEMQDFITYWVPRMQEHPKHFVRFVLNEAYNQSASITVTPKPDHLVRVFMLWSPMEKNQEITVKEQALPALQRGGFTLVEWGGTEIPLSGNSLTNQ